MLIINQHLSGPAAPPALLNWALSSNGGVATASSSFNALYPPSGANNGDRKGAPWGNGGAWNCANPNAWPDWLQVQFAAARSISKVDVFGVQNNRTSPIEPTESMTFSAYGLIDFDMQYWNGSTWLTVPGGEVRGNNLVWRSVEFTPITTDRVRVLIHFAASNYSRVAELEAWGV